MKSVWAEETVAAWLRALGTSQNCLPGGWGGTPHKITRYTEVKSLARRPPTRLRERAAVGPTGAGPDSEVRPTRRRTTGRPTRALGGGAKASHVGRAALAAISLTRTRTDKSRPWPSPGRCGEVNPRDRPNHLLTGRGRKRNTYKSGHKKHRNSGVTPNEPLHIALF